MIQGLFVLISRVMLNLPIARQHSIGPLILCLLCIFLFSLTPDARELLAYNRPLVGEFQWWRLLTGNLLHTNANHLILNIAGVLLLWGLHGQYFTIKSYGLMFILLSIGTTTCIYFFAPSLIWYVGLSGVLHGVFLLGAYFDIKQGYKSSWLLVIGVIVKVIHEQWFGASPEIAKLIDANVAIDAHLYGTVSGIVMIVVLQGRRYLSNGLTGKMTE